MSNRDSVVIPKETIVEKFKDLDPDDKNAVYVFLEACGVQVPESMQPDLRLIY